MDIDVPNTDSADLEADTEVEDTLSNGLKRSSSAPLINQEREYSIYEWTLKAVVWRVLKSFCF